MKKILIGLFLVASLSVLGTKNQISNTANNVKYEKYPIDHEITYIEGHYEIDPKYEDMYSKEKKDFKDKYTTYNEKKDYKNLIPLLKKYIEKYPNDAFAYETLGTTYGSMDNFKEAENYYLKAIELGDTDTAKYSLALLYTNEDLNKDKKKMELSEKYVKELENEGFKSHYSIKDLRNTKNGALIGNAYAILKLAAFYNNYGNHKLAEKYATEFLEFDKENIQNLNILSEAYNGQKKYEESKKFFLPLAQKGNTQAQYLLAITYYHDGKLKEAENWAKKALAEAEKRKHSHNTEISKNLLNLINSKQNIK